MIYPLYKSISGFNLPLRPLRVSKTACWCNKRCINMLCHVIFIFSHWDISDHFWLMMLWSLLLTVLSAPAWTIATVCCVMPLNTILISYNNTEYSGTCYLHPMLLACRSLYIGHQLDNTLCYTNLPGKWRIKTKRITWCARQIKSRSCLCKNLATTSAPNVNETPRSFSPQPIVSLSGSDHSRSHNSPWSGTSVGRMIRRICSIDCRSGLKPANNIRNFIPQQINVTTTLTQRVFPAF